MYSQLKAKKKFYVENEGNGSCHKGTVVEFAWFHLPERDEKDEITEPEITLRFPAAPPAAWGESTFPVEGAWVLENFIIPENGVIQDRKYYPDHSFVIGKEWLMEAILGMHY